jgi:hypothetical protein
LGERVGILEQATAVGVAGVAAVVAAGVWWTGVVVVPGVAGFLGRVVVVVAF